MARKQILILGGGAAGHEITYRLREVAEVTLVDPKTYWEVPTAVPRLLVDPEGLDARLSFASFLGEGRHIQGRAVAITDRTVLIERLAGGEETLTFDYAVIATGSAYLDPLIKAEVATEAERSSELRQMYDRLKAARSVVVVGGGPVGVEVAAELRETFPSTPVTLVHGGSDLLEGGPSRFPQWAVESLEGRGVTLVMNDRVVTPKIGEQPSNGTVVTKAGRIIPAEAIIWAAGTRPRTEFVATSWPRAVEVEGQIRVDRFLRVQGHDTVFAVGDVVNTPEHRLALVSSFHAKSVAANLKRLIASDDPASVALKPYKPIMPGRGFGRLMIVSLGRRDGLTSLPFGQFRASFFARFIKSRDMLVGNSRKTVGV